MNGYELTRTWYNHKFEHPEKVKAKHSDMFFYLVDLWNRLGQKNKFGLPTSVTMEALGIGSYNTFKATFDDLIKFGFIELISESKNQYQSRVIALLKIDKAPDKALDEANAKAPDKAPDESPDTIIEQMNNRTNEQMNNIDKSKKKLNISESKNGNIPTWKIQKLEAGEEYEYKPLQYLQDFHKKTYERVLGNELIKKLRKLPAPEKKKLGNRFNKTYLIEGRIWKPVIIASRLSNYANSWVNNHSTNNNSQSGWETGKPKQEFK